MAKKPTPSPTDTPMPASDLVDAVMDTVVEPDHPLRKAGQIFEASSELDDTASPHDLHDALDKLRRLITEDTTPPTLPPQAIEDIGREIVRVEALLLAAITPAPTPELYPEPVWRGTDHQPFPTIGRVVIVPECESGEHEHAVPALVCAAYTATGLVDLAVFDPHGRGLHFLTNVPHTRWCWPSRS